MLVRTSKSYFKSTSFLVYWPDQITEPWTHEKRSTITSTSMRLQEMITRVHSRLTIISTVLTNVVTSSMSVPTVPDLRSFHVDDAVATSCEDHFAYLFLTCSLLNMIVDMSAV